jgi:hypothetical protein
MLRRARPHGRLTLLLPIGLVLTGCGLAPKALTGPPQPGEHCAALLDEAFPGGEIAITNRKIVMDPITTTIVTLDGTRDVTPSNAVAREVAAECRYDHGVLMDFHWTKPPFH